MSLLSSSPRRFRGRLFATATPALALASLVTISTVALTGCGSGGGNETTTFPGGVLTPSPSASPSPAASGFANRTFAGKTVTLTSDAPLGGNTAALSVTTGATNRATGTLTITDPTRKASRLVIATPTLSGTFDPQTGALNLSGSFVLGGVTYPIRIVGTLPVPPALTGGSLTYTIGGQSYTTTFGAITPSPSPRPSPSPSPSPSAGTGPFTGTVTSGSNATTGTYSADSASGSISDDEALDRIAVSFTSAAVSGNTIFGRTVIASYDNEASGGVGEIVVGKDLPVGKRAVVNYRESVSVVGSQNPQLKTFIAESGSFTVTERTATRVRVRLNNLRMVPAPNQASSDLATGAFTLTGEGYFTP